jgi:hypothetical protein
MSELRADTITASDGTSPVTLTKQSAAKAWYNLNATATPALRDSFNISTITDEGTGRYEGNFTSAMGNANYVATGSNSVKGNDANSFEMVLTTGDEADTYGLHSTAAIRSNSYASNAADYRDPTNIQLVVHGDLA